MPEQFTVEEVNLMCIYDTSGRGNLIAELTAALGGFEDEMLDIAVAVIYRLAKMSDAEFSALELYPEYDEESEV